MSDELFRRLIELNKQDEPASDPEFDQLVRTGLTETHSRSIRVAAELAAKVDGADYVPDLLKAYDRLLENPLKTDPGCEAKTEIVQTLGRSGYDNQEFYLEAIQYRQHEPIYGGSTDTAAKLRVLAGFALTELNRLRAVGPLVELLVDPESTARAGAARALVNCGESVARHLLRLKVEFGDKDPRVLGEVCSAYLAIAREEAVPIVAKHLSSSDLDTRLETAMALGDSRLLTAFEYLQHQVLKINDREEARMTLTAIALLQHHESTQYLLDHLEPASTSVFKSEAIQALSHVRDRASIRSRLQSVLAKSNDKSLQRAFRQAFDS